VLTSSFLSILYVKNSKNKDQHVVPHRRYTFSGKTYIIHTLRREKGEVRGENIPLGRVYDFGMGVSGL